MGKKGKQKGKANQTASTNSQVSYHDSGLPELPTVPPFRTIDYKAKIEDDGSKMVASYIGRTLKIELSDGRIVIGKFNSIDNHNNIVLLSTYQAHIKIPIGPNGKPVDPTLSSTKNLGPILIPGTAIVKVHLAKYPETPSAGSSDSPNTTSISTTTTSASTPNNSEISTTSSQSTV